MRKKFTQLIAAALAVTLCIPTSMAVTTNDDDEIMIRVGLASSHSHNSLGTLVSAHLQNNTGHGFGFRFGYYDRDLNFVELGSTDKDVTAIAMLKTKNLYYGYDSALGKTTYSDQITSKIAVGCYHIQIPGSYAVFEDAAEDAAIYDGFVAWIDGSYRVRVGAYLTKADAEWALDELDQGKIVGTSSYGINVVETGTDQILFQYDDEDAHTLGVLPDVTGARDVYTWFSGIKYRGGFTYQRIGGDNITVVNVLELEDYVKGVAPYEMGREWPLEALKAQATCARTYGIWRMNYHNDMGFDLCNSDNCQVYNGVGSNRTDWGASDLSDRAVDETAGQVVWYKSTLAETYYSSSHGGASENIYNVWGSNEEKYPYLCGVIDPYEETIADRNNYSSWTVNYTSSGLTQRLQGRGYGVGTEVDYLTLTYSKMGNVIKVEVFWKNGQKNSFTPNSKGGTIRNVFSTPSIRFTINNETVTTDNKGTSTGGGYAINGTDSVSDVDGLYAISKDGDVGKIRDDLYVITGTGKTSALEENQGGTSGTNEGGGTVTVSGNSYAFNGSGWGHSLGMSQFGANAMARLGYTYDEIVEFYYPGTNVDDYE